MPCVDCDAPTPPVIGEGRVDLCRSCARDRADAVADERSDRIDAEDREARRAQWRERVQQRALRTAR